MINKIILAVFVAIIFWTQIVNCDNICTATVCCPNFCSNCSTCIGDISNDANCCETTILSAGRTCGDYDAPCITTNNSSEPQGSEPSLWEKIISFFLNIYTTLGIGYLIIIGIGLVIFLCMIYACTCFDKRSPAIDYDSITIGEYKPKKSQ